jgi:hypothetical protein
MPGIGRFAPVSLGMPQVTGLVMVMRSGPRFICAERGYEGSDQPNQRSPTDSRQPPPDSAAQGRTVIAHGNADLRSACPRGANGLGPPPILTTIDSPLIPAL